MKNEPARPEIILTVGFAVLFAKLSILLAQRSKLLAKLGMLLAKLGGQLLTACPHDSIAHFVGLGASQCSL